MTFIVGLFIIIKDGNNYMFIGNRMVILWYGYIISISSENEWIIFCVKIWIIFGNMIKLLSYEEIKYVIKNVEDIR